MAIDAFGIPPQEAVDRFREKGYRLRDEWHETWEEQHARAFTVARATQLDLLADIRAAVDDAIANGRSLQEFTRELQPTLVRRGWWGTEERVDSDTGEVTTVQLGSPRRLRTIYETNLRQAMAAGRWERMQRTASARPFGRYVAILDGRTRSEHRAWHGTILPLDHPWWRTHAPPNGWGCRCKIQQLSQRDLDRYGYTVSDAPHVEMVAWTNPRTGQIRQVPRGIDPSFGYNPGAVPRAANAAPAEPLEPMRTPADYGRPSLRDVQRQGGLPSLPELGEREYSADDRARIEQTYRETFNVQPNTGIGTLVDSQGEQVLFDANFLDHLRGAHKGPGETPDPRRVQYLPAIRETIERPFEIWLVPMRLRTGAVVMRKRYIGLFNDGQILMVGERREDGYLAWTSMPSRRLESQRVGYLLYGAEP